MNAYLVNNCQKYQITHSFCVNPPLFHLVKKHSRGFLSRHKQFLKGLANEHRAINLTKCHKQNKISQFVIDKT